MLKTRSIEAVQMTFSAASEVYRMVKEVWLEHYTKYYPEKFVRDAAEAYLAPNVVLDQMKDGFQYYFLKADDVKAGVLAFKALPDEQKIYLGKLYINSKYRGLGLARMAIEIVEDRGREKQLNCIELQCAEPNIEARRVYERAGFRVSKVFVEHIAGGVSNELIMEKPITVIK